MWTSNQRLHSRLLASDKVGTKKCYGALEEALEASILFVVHGDARTQLQNVVPYLTLNPPAFLFSHTPHLGDI